MQWRTDNYFPPPVLYLRTPTLDGRSITNHFYDSWVVSMFINRYWKSDQVVKVPFSLQEELQWQWLLLGHRVKLTSRLSPSRTIKSWTTRDTVNKSYFNLPWAQSRQVPLLPSTNLTFTEIYVEMKQEKKAVALPNSDDVTHFNYWYLEIKWPKAHSAVCFRKNDLRKR